MDQSVLVVANSNSACDEIAHRLIDYLEPGQLYRMYAKSFRETPSAKLLQFSNYFDGRLPSLNFLNQFRVLICTINTAGCITRAREKDPAFSSHQYSHVFIDEAASVQMSVALVAIAG